MSIQIKLMEERIKNWKAELQKLENDTNISIQGMDTGDREMFIATIAEGDEEVRRERTQSFEKLKETYMKEMNKDGVDPDLFLLNYVGKTHQRSPKNVRGHQPQWRGRGRGGPQG